MSNAKQVELKPTRKSLRGRERLCVALCVLGSGMSVGAQSLPQTVATYDPPTSMDLLYESRAISVPAMQRERLFSFLAKMPEQFSGGCTEKTWLVIGYADRDEADAQTYTLLSQARAEAAKGLLVRAGITAERIRVEWFGSNRPVAQAGDAKNRRTEIEYAVCRQPLRE